MDFDANPGDQGAITPVPKTVVPQIRWQLARALQSRDPIYALVARLRNSSGSLLVERDTDLTIEGAPRSANTFFVSFCELLNPSAKLGHHLHVSAQVVRAHRYRVPCVVLIRDPFDAAASTLVWAPNRRPREVVADWIRFYERALLYVDDFVIADFSTAIDDPGQVLRQVNTRFGTSFNTSLEGTVTRDDVLRRVDERARMFDGAVYDTRLGRPSGSAERERLLVAAHERLKAELPGDMGARARRIRDTYCAAAERTVDRPARGEGEDGGCSA